MPLLPSYRNVSTDFLAGFYRRGPLAFSEFKWTNNLLTLVKIAIISFPWDKRVGKTSYKVLITGCSFNNKSQLTSSGYYHVVNIRLVFQRSPPNFLLILKKFKQINQLLLLLKSSQNLWFSDNFSKNRS